MTSAEQRGFQPNTSASKRLVWKPNTEVVRSDSMQRGWKKGKKIGSTLSKSQEKMSESSLGINWGLSRNSAMGLVDSGNSHLSLLEQTNGQKLFY